MKRKLTNLGAKSLLKLLGTVGTFTSMACGATPVYGMVVAAYGPPLGLDVDDSPGRDAAYGPRVCAADAECAILGEWCCGPSGYCVPGTRPDAGAGEDSGQ